MNAGTTDQSHVLKVYEIGNEVVQQVSLHCRTLSFHDFITDRYGRSYIMHLYVYISIVNVFICTISLVHSHLIIWLFIVRWTNFLWNHFTLCLFSEWIFHTCRFTLLPRYIWKEKTCLIFCATVWCDSLLYAPIWARSTTKATSYGWSFMVNNQVSNLHTHFTHLSFMYKKQFL